MGSPLEILLVDDDDNKRSLIAHFVARQCPTAHLVETANGAEAIEYLEGNRADAILTDHNMAPVDGVELIRWVRRRFSALPILMITGELKIEKTALEAGANLVLNFSRFPEAGTILAQLMTCDRLEAVC